MDIKQFTVYQNAEGTFFFKGKLTIHDLNYLKEFLDISLANLKKISLNMEEVEYADTASLQLLIAFKSSRGPDTEWEITNLSPGLEKILQISNLDSTLM